GHRPAERRPKVHDIYEFARLIVQTFHETGVRMVLGTDTPLPGMVPGFSLIEEIDEVSQAGFDRREALRAATMFAGEYAAELIPGGERFGRIAPGFSADLMLLTHDPVSRPFTCDDVRGVMTRGRWLGRDEIAALMASAAATPSIATR